jgi:predicted RecA/RadA family phage recombinase
MINTVNVRGDNLDFLESLIVHPSRTSGRTNSGDAVVIGRFVGVAASTATAATDRITVCLKGVFNIPVVPGAAAIGVGETVYIHPTTAVVGSDLTGVPFGTAVEATAVNATIAVRVFGQTPGAVGAGS